MRAKEGDGRFADVQVVRIELRRERGDVEEAIEERRGRKRRGGDEGRFGLGAKGI